jgi:hypothetical protein
MKQPLLKGLLSDGQTGNYSAKRAVVLLAGVVLALVAVVAARAVWFGLKVDPVAGSLLSSIATALAGVAGASYVGGKAVEAWRWRGGAEATKKIEDDEE